MSDLSDLTHALLAFAFVMPRVIFSLVLLPAFSSVIIGGMKRNGFAAGLCLFIHPLVYDQTPPEGISLITGAAIMIKEFALGLILGFIPAVTFWAAESTGFFIDNHRGSSMASSLDPLTGSQTSPLGNLFAQTLTAIFFVGGGFVAFIALLYHSFVVWPVFSFFPTLNMDGLVYFVELFDRILFLTVVCGAPVIIAMFLSELSLALISRFAPQLNVFFLAMPVKSAVGILVLVLYLGVLMRFLADDLIGVAGQFELLQRLVQ